MPSYIFQHDPAKRGSVLTKFQPVISYGGPNSSHFDVFSKDLGWGTTPLVFWVLSKFSFLRPEVNQLL